MVLFCEEKYQKSARRTRAVLLPNHRGVHELVARSSAWRVCAARGKAKIGGFALRAISSIPRVRTYHTKKPSRFVHALSHPHTNTGDAVARIFIFPYSSFKSFL